MRLVRSYQTGDAAVLGQVFHRAVREGAAPAYGEAERAAWSPAPPCGEAWERRLASAETVVAEEGGAVVGFMSLDLETGCLDLAFVLPDVQGKGVASALYAVLETRSRAAGLARLTTEASLVAEPFFLAKGWSVARRQEVLRRGVALPNAVMEKELPSAEVAA